MTTYIHSMWDFLKGAHATYPLFREAKHVCLCIWLKIILGLFWSVLFYSVFLERETTGQKALVPIAVHASSRRRIKLGKPEYPNENAK